MVSTFEKVLSAEERDHAHQYYHALDRARFISGRSILKTILSQYLSCPPEEVCILKTAAGKPYLRPDRTDIEFSVTHSRDLALYSLVKGRRIGIDVESTDPSLDTNPLCSHFLTPREQAIYHNTPENDQRDWFLTKWTLKEAYVKALGVGHSCPFNALDTAFLEVDDSTATGDAPRTSTWSAYHFTPAFNYLAALVVDDPSHRFLFPRSVYYHLDP
jgi:4'-phosphopantetheinyl transferase